MQREPFFNLKISDIIKKIINFSKNDIPNSISVVLYNDWVSQSKKHRRELWKTKLYGKCEFNNSTLKGLVGDIITYSKQNINNTNISSSINPIYKEIEGRYFVMSDFDNLSITIYPN